VEVVADAPHPEEVALPGVEGPPHHVLVPGPESRVLFQQVGVSRLSLPPRRFVILSVTCEFFFLRLHAFEAAACI